jgi:uncharacterized protein (TIGR02569 family)
VKEALKYFAEVSHFEKLQGGQNTSVKAGQVVLKPIEDVERYCWLASQLEPIQSTSLRIAKPIRSKRGNWIEDGYGATEFIVCKFHANRMTEKLAVAQEFHDITKEIKKPIAFDSWLTPWSKASRVAWREAEISQSVLKNAGRVVHKLLQQYENVEYEDRFVHSDLAGNILFNGKVAVVIDLSPDFRSVEYALTMLVTDSIAWHEEPAESLRLLPFPSEERKQLILRAVLFRLCVPLFSAEDIEENFFAELRSFLPVLNFAGIRY